jgi:membrane associated rhomboid family serine protease
MIPLRDDQARHRFTAINILLIAVNLAVFLYEISLGDGLGHFVDTYAMVPARLASIGGAATSHLAIIDRTSPLITLVTSMFLHGGVLHIAGNMLYLFIFGAAVEEAMGAARYLAFYLVAGIVSALAMAMVMPQSHVPVIGASGAIAGVLGAYFILHPGGRIRTILPVIVLWYVVDVPALVYLLIWFAAQLYWGISDTSQASGGVAWWAHVGGFLFGIAMGPILRKNDSARSRR